ncbi:hypothetical protein DSUL_60181 [Desulfovibrionales bacterium]
MEVYFLSHNLIFGNYQLVPIPDIKPPPQKKYLTNATAIKFSQKD